jgi:2-succinyl-6-hydroxy-2,4-cyclohexadiene-1-carboxylate synthase
MTPLFLLHGCLGQPSSWGPVRERLDPAIASTAVPLPGHGPSPSAYAHLESWDDVVASVLEQLPPSPVALCGYSMGARVALGLALGAPTRVKRAILIGCHPGLGDERARAERTRWDDAQSRRVMADGLEAFVADWERLELFESQRDLPIELLEVQRRRRQDHEPGAIAWALSVMGLGRMPDLRAELGRCRVPTLWIAGERDAKFRRIAAEVATAAPVHRALIAPGVGHNVALESPGWLAEILSAELGEDRGARR